MKGAVEIQSTISVSEDRWSNLDELKTHTNLPSKQKFLQFQVTYFLFLFQF